MNFEDAIHLPITELGELVRLREISPVELTEAYLSQIERLDHALQAFVTVTSERAIRDARRVETEIAQGVYHGALHGMPVAHKDVLWTQGVLTAAGSKTRSNFVPDVDACVVARLQAAGATLIGKSSTPEFTDGIDVELGLPYWPNPWDVERTSGGSSAGSGVAVAAGMCAVATGTDTGGSARQPAAFCGICALKPTYGLVSRAGMFPLSWSLDSVGLMARTTADIATMLVAVAGYDSADPTSTTVPLGEHGSEIDRSVRGLRVGIPTDHFFRRIEPAVAMCIDKALHALEGLGLEVIEIALPAIRDHSAAEAAEMTIMAAEAASCYEETLRTSPAELTRGFRNFLQAGSQINATDYLYAQKVRRLIMGDFAKAFDCVDVLVSPTVPILAPRHEEKTVVIDDVEEGVISAMWRLTFLSNLTGLPSLSVPVGLADGLPVGMQLTGRLFEDHTVLRIGHAYQKASGRLPRPPVERLARGAPS